jgi:hypothetical protein
LGCVSPDASTVCTSRKPTHPDHILSVLKPSSRCSVREEEVSTPKWLTAASVAAKASQGSVQSHSLHVGCVYIDIDKSSLNNGRHPPATSAYPVVPQISSAPFPQAWRPPLLPKASYPTVQYTSPQVHRHDPTQTTSHHETAHHQQSSQTIPDLRDSSGSPVFETTCELSRRPTSAKSLGAGA